MEFGECAFCGDILRALSKTYVFLSSTFKDILLTLSYLIIGTNNGQATTECQKCGIIIHTKCYKKQNFL